MTRFPRLTGLAAVALILAAVPASAQFSTAYEFMKAVEEQNYAEIRSLMIKCRCPNARNVEDVPVLVMAAQNGDLRTADFLVQNGANPSASGRSDKLTALMAFARLGHGDGVAYMIDAGADLDAGDATGETALMKAVRTRRPTVVRQLIEAGADVSMPDYQGRTALDIARAVRARDLERLLAEAE